MRYLLIAISRQLSGGNASGNNFLIANQIITISRQLSGGKVLGTITLITNRQYSYQEEK